MTDKIPEPELFDDIFDLECSLERVLHIVRKLRKQIVEDKKKENKND